MNKEKKVNLRFYLKILNDKKKTNEVIYRKYKKGNYEIFRDNSQFISYTLITTKKTLLYTRAKNMPFT